MTLVSAGPRSSPDVIHIAHVATAHWILANDKPHNTAKGHKFQCILRHIQNYGSGYKPPTKPEIGGALLGATFETYYNEEVGKLLQDAKMCRVSI